MRTSLVALALIGSMIGSAAVAGQASPPPPPPRAGPAFEAMLRADTDADGTISRAEFIAASDVRFAKMDANGDGKVTLDERRAAREAMRERIGHPEPPRGTGRGKGPDGDGTMTLVEARARAAERFDRMDANGDGRLDRAELSAMRPMRRGPGGPPPPPPPPASPTPPAGAAEPTF